MTKAEKFLAEAKGYEMEPSYKGFNILKRGSELVALNDDGMTKYAV